MRIAHVVQDAFFFWIDRCGVDLLRGIIQHRVLFVCTHDLSCGLGLAVVRLHIHLEVIRHDVPGFWVHVVSGCLATGGSPSLGSFCNATTRKLSHGCTVLGPLLWNVVYDVVLREALSPGCHIVCYAGDMLVVVKGVSWERAVAMGNWAVPCAIGAIKSLDLRVAPEKIGAVFFHDGSAEDSPRATILVDKTRL